MYMFNCVNFAELKRSVHIGYAGILLSIKWDYYATPVTSESLNGFCMMNLEYTTEKQKMRKQVKQVAPPGYRRDYATFIRK